MAKKKIKIEKHALIPLHKKLSKKDKDDLLNHYNITIQQLPAIKLTDAAVKDMSVELGDLVQITRGSRTSGITTFYRVVVNG